MVLLLTEKDWPELFGVKTFVERLNRAKMAGKEVWLLQAATGVPAVDLLLSNTMFAAGPTDAMGTLAAMAEPVDPSMDREDFNVLL